MSLKWHGRLTGSISEGFDSTISAVEVARSGGLLKSVVTTEVTEIVVKTRLLACL